MFRSLAWQEFSRSSARSERPESRPDVRVHMEGEGAQAGPFKTTSPNRRASATLAETVQAQASRTAQQRTATGTSW